MSRLCQNQPRSICKIRKFEGGTPRPPSWRTYARSQLARGYSVPRISTPSFKTLDPPLLTALVSSTATSRMDPFLPKANMGEHSKATDTIVVTPGIPALKPLHGGPDPDWKICGLGLSKPLSSLSRGLEGKVVLLQAADVVQTKRLIPDLSACSGGSRI